MNLTQDTLAPLIHDHDHDTGAQLDPLLAGLVLTPQELADLATLLLITANRIDYGAPRLVMWAVIRCWSVSSWCC